ncbi:MAG TPA: gamma-glutamyltransferase [Longimicrobiales bacterium]|nr:gamma-glutamyltransferase [Longimicrobiales bacterium]
MGGLHGAVVAGHPLAVQAGLARLQAGGNAVDAAVTMAGVLAVVRPHMNGVGGDAFGLFYEAATRRVTALNASGRAAVGATPELFAERGLDRMPGRGALSVTVPGAVSAWQAALERYGTITLAVALQPAIALAEGGFMVSETLAEDLEAAASLNEGGQRIYMPGGEPLAEGDILRSPALAATLRRLATDGPPALYGGAVGRAVAAFLETEGSPLRLSDFSAHQPEWTDPISTTFRGRRVYTPPPNSSGLALLQMLAMAETLPLESFEPNSTDLLHRLVEMKKLAFADRARWIADPAQADVPTERLLDADYLRSRAALVEEGAADGQEPGFGRQLAAEDDDGEGDTVYLAAVDQWGNAVSWIQSLFATFGSGLVDPETGIVLQNRGAGFTLQEGHPNRIAPGKRPFHTLMPVMLTDADGDYEMSIGTPGGDVQPQAVTQALVQMLVFGMSPQRAIEAPRFASYAGARLRVEDRLPTQVAHGLEALGHEVEVAEGWTAPFGNLQVIWRLPNDALRTGADMRREGASAAY